MLEVLNLSHQWQRRGDGATVLDNVHFTVPGGHLVGLLGAVNSGKSTLVRLLCGLVPVQAGVLMWKGDDVTARGLPKGRVGYVGNDEAGILSHLNVKEHVVSAIMLRVEGVSRRDAVLQADKLLVLCGLDGIGGSRAGILEKAQKRRLTMAVALASDPVVVVCDEFTSGVDPRTERELGALLQMVTKAMPGRVVLNATQSLADLSTYDSVVVVHEGKVAFHGPGRALTHYFSIPHTEDLYHRLAKRPADRWQDSWDRHCDSYYDAFKLLTSGGGTSEAALSSAEEEDGQRISLQKKERPVPKNEAVVEPEPSKQPGVFSQLRVLMRRRWTMFRRRRRDLWAQAALVAGLPLVAILFAGARSPELQNWASATGAGAVGGAFLSLFFFMQVLLLMLAAVKTAGGEAVEDRGALPTEQVGGLRMSAWIGGKVLFVSAQLLAQSLAMALLTEVVLGAMPGHGGMRALLLVGTSLAFGMLCLGTSAWSRNVEQGMVRCGLLLAVNVVACGALLVWPRALASVFQPLLTAYYGWSGSVDTLSGTPWFEGVKQVNGTWFATPGLALVMLTVHLVVGVVLLVTGLKRRSGL